MANRAIGIVAGVAALAGPVFVQAQVPARDTTRPPSVGTAVLSGTVMTDEPNSRPVRRAVVTIAGSAIVTSRLTVTDDEGRFVFTRLPAGNVTLYATKAGYVTAYNGAKRPGRAPGVPIAIGDGMRVAAKLRMPRGAVITGIVMDQSGRPAPQVSVQVLQYQTTGGDRMLMPVLLPGISSLGTPTDDRGVYRIYGLPPGDFIVGAAPPRSAVTGEVRQTSQAELQWAQQQFGSNPRSGQPPPRGPTIGYAPVYYPGTLDQRAATTITLRAGEERSGVDLVTQTISTARVEGTVVDPDGRPVSAVQISVLPKSMAMFDPLSALGNRTTAIGGRFAVSGIAPGEYTLSARAVGRSAGPGGPPAAPVGRDAAPAGPSLWAMADISVAGQDVTGVELKLEPGLALSGRVVAETATAAPTDFTRFRMNLRTWTTPGAVTVTLSVPGTPPNTEGKFSFAGIVPGRYAVSAFASGMSADGTPAFVLKSIVAGGRDVADVPFEIKAHEDSPELVVTFTDKVTELSGTLFDAAGRPTPDFSVIVFATNRALWTQNSRRIRSARPASDGKFKVGGLPPGEYFMAAVADYEPAELYDASFLDLLAAAGYKVTLAEGEKKTQDLKLAGGM